MTAITDATSPILLEFIPSSAYTARLPPTADPFRHQSLSNSHNHHERHPWGPEVAPNTEEFDALYAKANNEFMYHLWYTPELAPFMATKMLLIHKLSDDTIQKLEVVLGETLKSGIDIAMKSATAQQLIVSLQNTIDNSPVRGANKIFIRLGATSAKDSFAINVPTAKPSPLEPDADMIVRRLLTSGRCVGRLLALTEGVWKEDPGEALVFQEWSADIELRREFRVFCHRGRVTAISQDIWWEKLGWREEYSEGFVEAITGLWEQVRGLLPFDTCTMDVLMTKDMKKWTAAVIEFNGFGAHLNTGSDLFHWVNDAEILEGSRAGITVRFVDDFERNAETESIAQIEALASSEEEPSMPDWLALETKLRANYGEGAKEERVLKMDKKAKLPLRGRWCSAY